MRKFLLAVLFLLLGIYLPAQTQLEEAVVIATRASQKTPVAQTTMNAEDIKERNIRVEVPQLIELTPSVVSMSESGLGTGNTSFRIRGTDPSRINITMDGVPINDAESQAVFWVNTPGLVSSLGSIQIQRGVGTSGNGAGAFGATVSLQTNLPSDAPSAELSSTIGSYNTFDYNIKVGTGSVLNGFRFDLRYSNIHSDGYVDRSWSKHQSLFFSGAWSNKNTLIKTIILHGNQHTGISWSGVPAHAVDSERYPYFSTGVSGNEWTRGRRYNPAGEYLDNDGKVRYYDNQSDNYNQTYYLLHAVRELNANWKLTSALHLTRGTGYYEEYKLNAKLEKYKLPPMLVNGQSVSKSDLIRNKLLDNYFYGFSSSLNYLSSVVQWNLGIAANRYDGDHFGKVIWLRYNAGQAIADEWYRNTGTKDDYTVYSKTTLKLFKLSDLFVDVQYRHIDYTMKGVDDDLLNMDQAHAYNFFNPKAGMFFRLNKQNSAYWSLAVGQREPSRADIKDALKKGGKDLPQPEKLYNAEFGYKYSGSALSFGVNLYYMYYKDQLVATGKMNDVGYIIMENVDQSYRAGVELMGALNLGTKFKLNGNLSVSRNKIKNLNLHIPYADGSGTRVDYFKSSDISFSPNVIAGAQIQYSLTKNWQLGISGKYVGEQYYDNSSSADRRLDAYYFANLQTDYSFQFGGVQFMGSLLVNNILDRKYSSSAAVYRFVSNNAPDYVEAWLFPQAGRNVLVKISIKL